MIYKVEIEHPANHSTYYVAAKDVCEAATSALKHDASLLYEDDTTLEDDKRFIAVNRCVKSVQEFAHLGQFVPRDARSEAEGGVK